MHVPIGLSIHTNAIVITTTIATATVTMTEIRISISMYALYGIINIYIQHVQYYQNGNWRFY